MGGLAGRKQMMRKWWKQMHKCEKSDADSTEKAASPNEDKNDVHVKTEANKDCKTEVSYFNSITLYL